MSYRPVANCNVTGVGFSSPKPSCLYIVYGKRLTLAPKSRRVFSMLNCPITHRIVSHPISLYLKAFPSEIRHSLAPSKIFSFVHYGVASQCNAPLSVVLIAGTFDVE